MAGLAALIALALAGVAAWGLALTLTAFSRRAADESPAISPAQVVRGDHSPIPLPRPRRRLEVAPGRLALGIALLVLGGFGMFVALAIATFASGDRF